MTPIALIILATLCLALYLICRKQLKTTLRCRAQIMRFDEKEAITNVLLLKKSAVVFVLVLFGFTAGHAMGIEPGTVALSGAALLMLLAYYKQSPEEQGESVHHVFAEVEWVTIFFFMGLFIIVGAVEHSGLLTILGNKLIAATNGEVEKMTYAVLWVSAILSSVLDNIPFVATMIPLLEAAGDGIPQAAFEPIWWALALGACLGGNGTLIGASANLTVAAFAEKAKQPIGMIQYAKYGFILMLTTIVMAHIYLWLRYF